MDDAFAYGIGASVFIAVSAVCLGAILTLRCSEGYVRAWVVCFAMFAIGSSYALITLLQRASLAAVALYVNPTWATPVLVSLAVLLFSISWLWQSLSTGYHETRDTLGPAFAAKSATARAVAFVTAVGVVVTSLVFIWLGFLPNSFIDFGWSAAVSATVILVNGIAGLVGKLTDAKKAVETNLKDKYIDARFDSVVASAKDLFKVLRPTLQPAEGTESLFCAAEIVPVLHLVFSSCLISSKMQKQKSHPRYRLATRL